MEDFIKTIQEEFAKKDWRFTSSVRNIAQIIFRTKVPLSVLEIHNLLKKKERKVDQTTIYRIVDRLVALDAIHLLNGQILPCADMENHDEEHHFLVCESCGEADEIFLNYKDAISRQLDAEKNFKLRQTDLIFYGLCEKCRGKFD